MKLGRGITSKNDAIDTNVKNYFRCFMITKIKNAYVDLAQKISAATIAPTEKQARMALFVAGVAILGLGLTHEATAQLNTTPAQINYNDERITNAVNAIMTYLEGSFGALIMAASGVGAIMSAAFGQYKAALSLMVVAVGAFILRSLIGTFFNDMGIQQ